MSLHRIGQRLNKNHVTVIHAARKIESDMNYYSLFREEIEQIEKKIQGEKGENIIDKFNKELDKCKDIECANMKTKITNLKNDNIALNNYIKLLRDKIKRLEHPYSLIY